MLHLPDPNEVAKGEVNGHGRFAHDGRSACLAKSQPCSTRGQRGALVDCRIHTLPLQVAHSLREPELELDSPAKRRKCSEGLVNHDAVTTALSDPGTNG
jgi:hypothetical protein